jgi:5-deoxy-D-glucuronate isomerase
VKCSFDGKNQLVLGDMRFRAHDRSLDIEEEDSERMFVLVRGEALFKVRDKVYRAKRGNPFNIKPAALYLPPNRSAKIEKKSDDMLMISSTFKSKVKGITKLIRQKDVKTTYSGNGSYRSKVRQIFENSNFACGETLCLPGKWVSETCKGKRTTFFKVKPEDSFGFIRTCNGKMDEVALIKDGTIVFFDGGNSTIASVPQTTVYFLWFLEKEEGNG